MEHKIPYKIYLEFRIRQWHLRLMPEWYIREIGINICNMRRPSVYDQIRFVGAFTV